MVRNSIKTQVAIFAAMVFVLGLNSRCMAQATDGTLVDTPTQRWLPPPKSYPTQQENQAKLLSRLRDSLLQGDGANQSNPSRLSDSDVQSLKEAMKQFESYFPEGLTPESLDAIPPELISKALSNPELVKQAKELAEKYSKETQKKKSKGQPSKPEEPSTETKPTTKAVPPNSQSTQKSQSPFEQDKQNLEERPEKSIRESSPKVDPKGKGFDDLMNKLRSTQQTYEQNQEPSNSLLGEPQSTSSKERSSRGVVPPPDFEGASPTSRNSQSPPSSRSDSSALVEPNQLAMASRFPPTRNNQVRPARQTQAMASHPALAEIAIRDNHPIHRTPRHRIRYRQILSNQNPIRRNEKQTARCRLVLVKTHHQIHLQEQ